MQRVLSTVVLLGLLVATAAAFVLTEHLKLIKSPVYGTHVTKVFSPICGCSTDKATISFKLRKPGSSKVRILDSHGNVIADLGSSLSGRPAYAWDGKTESGGLAPDGVYRPQIVLDDGSKTITMPNKITLDSTPPNVLTAAAGKGVLPLGDHHTVAITYTFSEPAHAEVFLNGQRIIVSHGIHPSAAVKWNGDAGGHPVQAGRYVLQVAAVDLAGNETPTAHRKSVVVVVRPAGKK